VARGRRPAQPRGAAAGPAQRGADPERRRRVPPGADGAGAPGALRPDRARPRRAAGARPHRLLRLRTADPGGRPAAAGRPGRPAGPHGPEGGC
jgi:hypothetical protein